MQSEWRSRRYLPHYDAAHTVQHIVFCLADALPTQVLRRMADAPPWERPETADTALDAGMGSRLLANDRAAAIVEAALLRFDAERYALMAWCVMPTHVHVVAEPFEDWPLPKVVHSWKSFTAHAINRALGRSGSIWFREYFDRAIRDERHLEAVVDYVERNPVSAGLCAVREDWRWSSAFLGRSALDAR